MNYPVTCPQIKKRGRHYYTLNQSLTGYLLNFFSFKDQLQIYFVCHFFRDVLLRRRRFRALIANLTKEYCEMDNHQSGPDEEHFSGILCSECHLYACRHCLENEWERSNKSYSLCENKFCRRKFCSVECGEFNECVNCEYTLCNDCSLLDFDTISSQCAACSKKNFL